MKKYNQLNIALVWIFSLFVLTACVDLNIPPKSILTGEDIYNEAGIKAYMAGMYNHLPMEDFKYDANANSRSGFFQELNVYTYYVSTGEFFNRNNVAKRLHKTEYWSDGFKIIRQANTLIKDLPAYSETLADANKWIGEAKFIRAYVYFQLVKRYGGMPIIEAPQVLDNDDESSLWIARSSHAATFDFILADLDDAYARMDGTSDAGRANKYVAAALKSRVALTAGTIARYGAVKFPVWEVDGVMLQGIPEDLANGYLKQAWDAAKLVENGPYELHRGNSDKTANYAEIWEKADSHKESIWIRKFDYLNWVHSYDAVMSPPRMTITYGDRFNPTLDWVELFDGLPLDPITGRFSGLDAEGNYLIYDNCHQLWDGAEPRLRANILLPGSTYKGIKLDLRSGLIIPSVDPATDKIKKFSRDDGAISEAYNNWPTDQTQNLFRNGTIIRSSNDPRNQSDPYSYTDETGQTLRIFKMGQDGPKASGASGNNTLTGFYGRKYMNLSMSVAQTGLHESTQSWIEIRYAEVLLNRAEAAIELAQHGESTYGGTNMLEDAFTCINNVRDRAGANLLTNSSELSANPAYKRWMGIGSFVEAPTRGLQLVRIERYKELAFEAKMYWDLRRWFTFDTQINQYRKRGLFAFMFCKGATVDASGTPDGKYIYDARATEDGSDRVTFNVNEYYETIPGNELKNNPLLQKNRNQ
ncbi:MAG: RagB/SusD family nutrient uptake outer membrane protein [Tannerella sp.]|jgi:hypothetical protein|nr:RagB/SusD family nutrient uptake outer membrane protein [Tannerella sp.]